jgi:hypothetical protein
MRAGGISIGAISLLLYAVSLPRNVMWRFAGRAALTLACARTMACAFTTLSSRAGLGGRVLSEARQALERPQPGQVTPKATGKGAGKGPNRHDYAAGLCGERTLPCRNRTRDLDFGPLLPLVRVRGSQSSSNAEHAEALKARAHTS